MFTRRFVFLAGLLATLNVVLWLAAPGLALRKALVAEFFGPKMIRLEVIERTLIGGSTDWHMDRGVITNVSPTEVTLREADTKIQQIPLAGTTRVFSPARRPMPLTALAKRWRVVVTWPATGAAQSVDVEKIVRRKAVG